MARQNAVGAALTSRLFWHSGDNAGEVGPPMHLDVTYELDPDGATALARGSELPRDLDEIVFLDLDRAVDDAMARMPADLEPETRARAADLYLIVLTMLVNGRDPTLFVGAALQEEGDAARAAVQLLDVPALRSVHDHLQGAVRPSEPVPVEDHRVESQGPRPIRVPPPPAAQFGPAAAAARLQAAVAHLAPHSSMVPRSAFVSAAARPPTLPRLTNLTLRR